MTIADGYQAIEDITTNNITCYKCSAKDSWCFYINDFINHESDAKVKCASNQCFIAEYLCDDKNSDDHQVEYNNAVNNGSLDFSIAVVLLKKEPNPLEQDANFAVMLILLGNYTFSTLKDCYADGECDRFYDPTFTSTRCVCETNLCNDKCNSADMCMIRNDLLSILASLYFFSYFLM